MNMRIRIPYSNTSSSSPELEIITQKTLLDIDKDTRKNNRTEKMQDLKRTQSAKQRRRGFTTKFNYITHEQQKQAFSHLDTSRQQHQGSTNKKTSMRLSASSPSAFQADNDTRAKLASAAGLPYQDYASVYNQWHEYDKDVLDDDEKTGNILNDYDGEDSEYRPLLGEIKGNFGTRLTNYCSSPWSVNFSRQPANVENGAVTRVSQPTRKVTRAESESFLSRASTKGGMANRLSTPTGTPSFTITGVTSTDEDDDSSMRSRSQTVVENPDFHPAKSNIDTGVKNTRANVNQSKVNGPSRRNSGTLGVGGMGIAQHKISQSMPHKASLIMVSPNSVSRSPSQQLMNTSKISISPCNSVMAASPSPTTIVNQTTPTPMMEPSGTVNLDHRLQFNSTSGLQNPLYNVSNEFMRVAGYSQQFKSLLSKRDPTFKKPGQENVTFASDAKDKDVEKGLTQIGAILPNGHELSNEATLAAAAIALGAYSNFPGAEGAGDGEKDPNVDAKQLDPRRPSRKSAYGRLWKEQPHLKHRMKMRKMLFVRRTKVSDFALLFALTGIILTILEAELTASGAVEKIEYTSYLLRSLIVVSTMILISLVIYYHVIETKISVIDSGAEDWRVAITYDRIWQCILEVAICSICPFPANIDINWDRLRADHRTAYSVAVPLDAVLSVPLFLRFYLFGRFMALHSRQFQDAATRSIAALNHIAVNFTFVLKTLMHEHPLRVLVLFTVAFWIAMSWILTQCERYAPTNKNDPESSENNHYLNSIWFIIITFMSIGYGDIVPNTYCGRALAITTGIVGAGVSSALIAVISRKLELSRAEKHVNQFMTDSKLTRQRKEAAASVLQHTWFIHKYKNIPKAKDDMKLRMHQRRFLASINEFRRVKWDQRKLAEQGNALVDVAKLQNDMHETLWDMQQNQDHLVSQMSILMQKVQELQEIILVQCSSQQQSPFMPGTRRNAGKPMVRQYSLHNNYSSNVHDGPQLNTPIVIAQHVDTGSVTRTEQTSLDDEIGCRAILL